MENAWLPRLDGEGTKAVAAARLAPHIPDDPTEAEVLSLLGHLTYGILYYCLAERRANQPLDMSSFTRYQIKDVKGICWVYDIIRQTESGTATLYIQGQPYSVPLNTLPQANGI